MIRVGPFFTGVSFGRWFFTGVARGFLETGVVGFLICLEIANFGNFATCYECIMGESTGGFLRYTFLMATGSAASYMFSATGSSMGLLISCSGSSTQVSSGLRLEGLASYPVATFENPNGYMGSFD